MTLSATTPWVEYDGDGVTTLFALPFYFLAAVHVTATLIAGETETALTYGADYTVAGALSSDPEARQATLVAAPANGVRIRFDRVTPATQESAWAEGSKFPSQAVERALDKLTMLVQESVRSGAVSLSILAEVTALRDQVVALDAAIGLYYDIGVTVPWRPDDGECLLFQPVIRPLVLPAGLPGSRLTVDVAPGVEIGFELRKGATVIATATVAADATDAVWVAAADVALSVTDVLSLWQVTSAGTAISRLGAGLKLRRST